jgi:hypothetical protein
MEVVRVIGIKASVPVLWMMEGMRGAGNKKNHAGVSHQWKEVEESAGS